MRQRFQTLFQPTGEVPLAAPSLREALPVWLIGVVASVGCLWLAHLGSPWVVPAAIAAGALALRSRRAADWLSWLPGGLVAASALEAVAPLARFGDLHYVELLALAVVVITLVRAIALEHWPRVLATLGVPAADD